MDERGGSNIAITSGSALKRNSGYAEPAACEDCRHESPEKCPDESATVRGRSEASGGTARRLLPVDHLRSWSLDSGEEIPEILRDPREGLGRAVKGRKAFDR